MKLKLNEQNNLRNIRSIPPPPKRKNRNSLITRVLRDPGKPGKTCTHKKEIVHVNEKSWTKKKKKNCGRYSKQRTKESRALVKSTCSYEDKEPAIKNTNERNTDTIDRQRAEAAGVG